MADLMVAFQRILSGLGTAELGMVLSQAAVGGYRLGLDTAQKDLGWEEKIEPDVETIAAIGMRTHALSDSTIARAKGRLAVESDKLYQELNAAMRGGMNEKEALKQIQARVEGLFDETFKDWELERLVRDQFVVATKEGRRSGWQTGGVPYRQWIMHSDGKTADDSKRMNGQITEIDEPYVDPKTGEKYMLTHMRPNDRCYEKPVWELPEDVVERKGQLYAKAIGHRFQYLEDLPPMVADVLEKYEYLELMNSHQLEKFRALLSHLARKTKEVYVAEVNSIELRQESRLANGLTEEGPDDTLLNDYKGVAAELTWMERSLEEAFTEDRKFVAVDSVMHSDSVALLFSTMLGRKVDEGVEEALNQVFSNRVAGTISKGGVGSGIRGHTTPKKIGKKLNRSDWESLEFYKEALKDLSYDEITGMSDVILTYDEVVKSTILNWYSDHGMDELQAHMTQLFGMSEKGARAGFETRYAQAKQASTREHMISFLKLYACTQAYLNLDYPDKDTVTVYRGVDGHTWEKFKHLRLGSPIDFETANVSCWSESLTVAKSFITEYGGVLVKMEVPKKQVFLHYKTGNSSHQIEQELTILGSKHKGELIDIRDRDVAASRYDMGVNTEEEARMFEEEKEKLDAIQNLEVAQAKLKKLDVVFASFNLKQDTKDLVAYVMTHGAPFSDSIWQAYLGALDQSIEAVKTEGHREYLKSLKEHALEKDWTDQKKANIIKMNVTVHHGGTDEPYILFQGEDPYVVEQAIIAAGETL
jgi:hypothetical protein